MENFLLIFDEIDDLFAMAGLLWRPIFSFVGAGALFVFTGFVFYRVPMVAVFLSAALLSLGLIDAARERRSARPSVLVANELR